MNLELRTVLDLASFIDPGVASRAASASDLREGLAILAVAAFPSVEPRLEADPTLLDACFEPRWSDPFSEQRYASSLMLELTRHEDPAAVIRRFASRHRLRIAVRELLPEAVGGAPVHVTARELSHLAAATIDAALVVATRDVQARFGSTRRVDGSPSTLCVIGMGKLGAGELNAGSDVDLVFFYDTDEGATVGPDEIPLHEFWTRVVRRMVPLLDEVTPDGFVWRVDLRLRPEGTRGPLVNALPAMLRYYETWGRLWERAAWTRAWPIAGDKELGRELMRELEPFVYRRAVDPRIANAMCELVEQARAERGDVERDLKLGLGGIRELETFVQALQLVWGGKNPSLRVRPTLEALDRLRAHGFVTEREASVLGDAYTTLRSAEHLVQNASGVQTHEVPPEPSSRTRLARSLGFAAWEAFDAHLQGVKQRVHACIEDLRSGEDRPPRWNALLASVDEGEVDAVQRLLEGILGEMATHELARDVVALGARPDELLGAVTRERAPGHAEALIEALVGSADPEQAARSLCACVSHRRFRPVIASALREPPALLRRFVTALGGSAFLGDLIVRHPELAEHALLSRGMPSPGAAARAVQREVESLGPQGMLDPELVAGAIRRAKVQVTLEVVLADMAEEVRVQDVTLVLSTLADACLDYALRVAGTQTDPVQGMCVVSVGKLGGNELGYGSDLDVLFVFEPRPGEDDGDAMVRRARQAQKAIRVISGVHEDGPGFELDTRLRPSGSQGVLVTSLQSFARYHGVGEHGPSVSVRAAAWERQTLLRARFSAGDAELGRRVMEVAHKAAYEAGPPDRAEIHRLRLRMESELGREKAGRFDLKLGRGGLVDVEFVVQALQMQHGEELTVRNTNTLEALRGLEHCGALDPADAELLRAGYAFLRKLEQRLHVVHNTSLHLLDVKAPGMLPLARRMGWTGAPGRTAPEQLMDRYASITSSIRDVYLRRMTEAR